MDLSVLIDSLAMRVYILCIECQLCFRALLHCGNENPEDRVEECYPPNFSECWQFLWVDLWQWVPPPIPPFGVCWACRFGGFGTVAHSLLQLVGVHVRVSVIIFCL